MVGIVGISDSRLINEGGMRCQSSSAQSRIGSILQAIVSRDYLLLLCVVCFCFGLEPQITQITTPEPSQNHQHMKVVVCSLAHT